MTKWARQSRPFVECQRDLQRVRDGWPQEPDLAPTRAEERFAAEVSLAQFHAQLIPTFAQERAMQILGVLASA